MTTKITSLAMTLLLLALAGCETSRAHTGDETTHSPISPATSESTTSGAPTMPTAWPPRRDGRWSHFETIATALAFLRRNLDVPIRLPDHLPSARYELEDGRVFLSTRDGERAAQFNLVFADGERLTLQYGVSVLDGCAPEASVPVRINGQPGRLRLSAGGRYSELIWPATLAHPSGVYGLSGWFTRPVVLAMAGSMPRLGSLKLLDAGC